MIRTYTVAGLATDKNGKTTVRYSSNLNKKLSELKRDGYTNLNFFESKTPKTKRQLCNMMLELIQFQHAEDIIQDELNSINARMITLTVKLGDLDEQ